MNRIYFLLAIAVTPVLGNPLPAADWPEFRGPTADGHYQGPELPTRWDAKTNIAWAQPIPGLGWSSPAIVGGMIFLTTATPGTVAERNQSLRALCLDTKTGKIVWNVEVFQQTAKDAPAIQAKNSHASPSPIVHDGKVYVHFGHQGTACLTTEGKCLWRNRDLNYPPVHGNGGSPVLIDGVLIFSCDGASDPFVVALDADTGQLKWKKARTWDFFKRFSFCTPLVIDVNGAKQVVLPGSGGVAAYDPKSGAEIWKASYDGYSVVPRPVFGHGMVFLSTGYETPSLISIRANGSGEVTATHVAWTLKRGAPHTPSPLLVGDELYVVSDGGFASCIDAKSGRPRWQERLKGNYSASPLLANGRIYFLNEMGLTTVVDASTTYKKVSENAIGEGTLASLAAADGAVYLRTKKHLYRISRP